MANDSYAVLPVALTEDRVSKGLAPGWVIIPSMLSIESLCKVVFARVCSAPLI